MRRLTKNQINEIKDLVEKGFSLNRISERMGLAKTTVYYHYFKFRGPVIRKVKIGFSSEFGRGEVVGIFAGDGSLWYSGPERGSHYQVRIHCGRNLEYATYVKNLFSKAFGKEFAIIRNEVKGWNCQYNVQTISKEVYLFFTSELKFTPSEKAPTVRIRSVKTRPVSFLFGFMKGLLDTDGTVVKEGRNRFRIAYYSTSREMLMQLKYVLELFKFNPNIYSTWRKPCINKDGSIIKPNYAQHTLYISRRKVVEFLNLINPYKLQKYL